MESLALSWLVLEITDSPFYLGVLAAARMGPTLLAPLGGAVADRMDRGRLLGLCQLGSAGIPAAMVALAATGRLQIWQVLFLAAISGVVSSFAQPSRQTLILDLVGKRQLVAGNALMRAAVRGGFMIGSPLAGFIVAWAGVVPCLSLVVVLDLAGAALAFMIRPHPSTSLAGRESVLANVSQVLRFVRRQPTILALLSTEVAFDFFVVPYSTLMPVFARDVLQVGPSGLGILLGTTSAGALLGALGMAIITSPGRKGAVLLGSVVLLGGALVAFALSPWYSLSLVILLAVGFLDSVAMTLLPTLILNASPEDMRGRVMGVYVLTWVAVPAGSLQAGAIATALGAPFAVGLGGVMVALYAAGVARHMLRSKAWD